MTTARTPARTTANLIVSSGEGPNFSYDPSMSAFTLKFPQNFEARADRPAQIALANASLYYSWPNVSARFNNTEGCSYVWVDGQTYDVAYPTGSYSVDNLNGFLQFKMRQNGHYLLDESGSEVYFLEFNVNSIYYTVTLTSTPVPDTLPPDWTNPASVPLNGLAPQLVIHSTGEWRKLLGFDAGSYPATQGSTRTEFNSQHAPIISPVTNVFVLCSFVNDGRFTIRGSVIGSFTPDVSYGQLLNYTPVNLTYYQVIPQRYSEIQLRLVDQMYRPLEILDPAQACFSLLLQ